MSVVSPFLTDSKNTDASIAKNIAINDGQDVLNWIHDDDVVVVDRGFRDSISAINRFGLNVQMPDFLKGKKQFPCKEANCPRCVTKVRWIVKSGNTCQLIFFRLDA